MSTIVSVFEFCKKEWPKDQTREQWVAALLSLDPAHITWKTPRMTLKHMLFDCGNKMWVSLLGLWGVVNYAPILVCRQYAAEQFISATHGLNQLEFVYGDLRNAAQFAELSKIWNEP